MIGEKNEKGDPKSPRLCRTVRVDKPVESDITKAATSPDREIAFRFGRWAEV